MCMSPGCLGKKMGYSSSSPKKGSFPKPTGGKTKAAPKYMSSNSSSYGTPRVRMSFGRKY